MIKPSYPRNESQRLLELLSFDVLDTGPDPAFDDFTVLASKICETPIALISLIDEKRQWFKSKIGLSADETSREISFCGHAINGDGIFEVPDATADPRFSDNPLVTGAPSIRFYAGSPIVTSNGFAIGTLCVIDQEKRTLAHDQKEALAALSRQVVARLELNRAIKKSQDDYRKLQELGKVIFSQNKQLIQSEKLATVGELTSGIAHEINNPLAVIVGRCSNLLELCEKEEIVPSFFQKELNKVLETSERIARIVRTMKQLVRMDDQDPYTSINSQMLVSEVLSLCEEKLKKNSIRVILDKIEDHCFVGNVTQLTQVLLNLIQNSLQAIKSLPDRWIEIRCKKIDESLCFEVIDSGKGIDESILDKIMNPFFTTKPPGVGTGLGLSIAKTIVESHGGVLAFASENQNTCFRFLIPVSELEVVG